MGAIGDYIHRSLQGYRKGKNPHAIEVGRVYAAKKKQIQQQIISSEEDSNLEDVAKNLENILNKFLTQGEGNPDYQKILEKFNNEVFIQEYPQYITDQFLKIRNRSGMKIREIIPQNDEVSLRTVRNTLTKIQNIS